MIDPELRSALDRIERKADNASSGPHGCLFPLLLCFLLYWWFSGGDEFYERCRAAGGQPVAAYCVRSDVFVPVAK